MADEYASLAELKRMRRVTDNVDDEDLLKALTRASRAIDKRTGRRPGGFSRSGQVTARSYQTRGNSSRLIVDEIASTSGLLINGTDYSDAGYSVFFWPENAAARQLPVDVLSRSSSWPCSVSISAEWGWPSIPDEVEEATLLLANRRWMRRNSPEGVAGWAAEGPIQVSRFDPDIEDLIQGYVLPGFGA